MDKNKAHDLLHMWAGGKSENCPVCTGECTDEQDMIARAVRLATEIAKPTIDPNMPYEETVFAKEGANTDETTTPPVEASPEAKTEDKKEVPAEALKAGEKKAKRLSVMTDVMSFAEGSAIPSRIKIIPAGTFKTPKYGDLEITREMLEQMRRNFHDGVRAGGALTGLPIDIEHGETSYRDAAAGWMKDIEVYDDGAYAKVEWTSLGEDLLSKGLYKFFSPEFTFDYVSNEDSVYYANVVTGGGLVNKPLFDHSLPPVMASEGDNAQNLTAEQSNHTIFITNTQNSTQMPKDNHKASILEVSKEGNNMDLQTILAKGKADRTSEEQAFVAMSLSELTREQKIAEGFLEVEKVAADETPAQEKKEEQDSNPAKSDETIAAAEKSNQVVISAAEYSKMQSELETLKAAAEKGTLAFKELEKKEVTEKVQSLVFSEKGGKIAPANVEPIVAFALKMGEAQRKEFLGIIEALPEQKIFGEQGSDENLGKNQAGDILNAKIKELTNTGMTFAEASKKVTAENPDLYAQSLKPASRD